MEKLIAREKTLRTLEAWGIPFALYEHAPVKTMDDCFKTPGIDWARTEMPKNVFLCNRQQTAFYLLLLRHDVPFRTAQVSRILGVSRLSFAPTAFLPDMLGLESGAVSPFGLLNDPERRVTLVLDGALRAFSCLAFHPCDNTATAVLSAQDFYGLFLPRLGRVPLEIDLAAPQVV